MGGWVEDQEDLDPERDNHSNLVSKNCNQMLYYVMIKFLTSICNLSSDNCACCIHGNYNV